ncbi:carboxylesterase/lipase family protein [Tenggerimyces flavus]|uniref:Carboxylic ester hydrolase n=1 Tax=Tenggerimyces flavus TaxID=1708749 RepID=A0ABV7YCK8_9ACTN|nr:carboxylesterase family protein [Tenggerimyces flavus]MBM7783816.1 para-nitrobenzyl esterase [Tenggerimyces flavus]
MRIRALALTLLVACAVAVPATAHASPSPEPVLALTTSGPVSGLREGLVNEFRGIPYAAPPVGELRWRAPRPVRPWLLPRSATAYASPCAQRAGEQQLAGSSEDCLYLNVTTPRSGPSRKPVMVWIHGGGNFQGAGSTYDPRRMAERGDVVVVTINYRVGAFGFLSHPGLEGSGTFGLQDQQAALRWVRRNAALFGGDSRNVTVFGESAGGVDICGQLTSPASNGLFDKAILQSGSCLTRVPTFATPQDGAVHLVKDDFWAPLSAREPVGVRVAEELGCGTVSCLRLLPTAKLLPYDSSFGIATGTPTLPRDPGSALRAGAFHRVPVLSGNTRDEARLTTMFVEALTGPITRERYAQLLLDTFGADAPAIERRYPADDSAAKNALTLASLDTDRVFACAQQETTRLLARRTAAYGFEFADRTAPTFSPFFTELPPGASHASELAYLFKLLDGAPYGPNLKHVELTAAQRRLGDAMIDAWTRFAHTGRPGWPKAPYVQAFGQRIEPIDATRVHKCDLWDHTPSAVVR